MSVSRHQYPYSHGLQRAANDGGDPLRSEVLLYPRTFYTDVNRLWLLSIFDTAGEVIFAVASGLIR
jgi:hypothetical protein